MASRADGTRERANGISSRLEFLPFYRKRKGAISNHSRPDAPLSLKIDAESLVSNWRFLSSLAPTAKTGIAVKADAYGLGARRVVPLLNAAGCSDFFVSYASEAADIVDLIDPTQVSFLHGPLRKIDALWAIQTGVRPVINSVRQAQLWIEAGGGLCDIMVDSGINRLGLLPSELSHDTIQKLNIDCLHSHLSSAEENSPKNNIQLSRWNEARNLIPHRRAALANSAGIALGTAFHGDLTRPGIAIYGGVPCKYLADGIKQVARPMAMIMQIRTISTGESVGYNATFVADRTMRVAVIALGYADGYLRCWSGKGAMLFDGKILPVIGRVSMDMTIININSAPELKEGDWVEAEYSLPEASKKSGLSQYELITLLAARFAR